MMTGNSASPDCRPRTAAAEPIPDDMLEELRQLRASIAIYQQLVQRLMERNQSA